MTAFFKTLLRRYSAFATAPIRPAQRRFCAVVAAVALVCIACAVLAGYASLDAPTRLSWAECLAEAASVLAMGLIAVLVVVVALWLLPRTRAAVDGTFLVAFFAAFVALYMWKLSANLVKQIWFNEQMVVMVGHDHVQLSGAVGNDLSRLLSAALKNTPQARYLYLGDNIGGDTNAMLDAFPLLLAHRIDTVIVGGACNSACAFLALLMPNRLLTDGGSLGFHDVTNLSSNEDANARVRAEIIERAVRAGVPIEHASTIFDTGPIRTPDRAELCSSRYITGFWGRKTQQQTPC